MGKVRRSCCWLVAAAAALPSAAAAQRADENAVTSAADGFGSSVGNERVGIYNPFNARGFSPTQAGNVRIEGLYFDLQTDLDSRVISGVAMRVGISAQSYPFSSPTGIADFSLRKPGDEAVLSLVGGFGPFEGVRAEADGQVPVSSTLSLGGGVGFTNEETHYGADRRFINAAVVARWRPSEAVEVVPFYSRTSARGLEAQPIYFTAGSFLPPQIERRRYHGPSWARSATDGANYGILSTLRSGGWTLQGGLFRSDLDLIRTFTELSLNTTREGIGDRYISAEADRRFVSTSGELRASRRFEEGPRQHVFHLSARGRDQARRYGGGRLISLGRGPIDELADPPQPDLAVGPQSNDRVRQYTLGLGYEGRWRNVGELSVGVQKTDYRKRGVTPAGDLPESRDAPILLNATAAVHLSPRITFYAGYARGLEESPVAPSVAINRDEAPPALLTEQVDAGVRIVLPRNLRLVAGLFEVKKPYFGLDDRMFFGRLGEVRHRGIELSLAGSPLPGLTTILGTVLLDADLSGEAVDLGLVGPKPVGTFVRHTIAALDYRPAWAGPFSFDLAYESTSDRVADRLNSFIIPARYVVSLGGRYRFRIGESPATLRAQIGTVNNRYGWNNLGEGFHYNLPRRYSLSLSADI